MKPIFIIGLPGAGKTTLAKKLAIKLDLLWLDTDILIEELYFANTGKRENINTIFTTESPLLFRNMERKVLRAIPLKKCIVSCGGGLPCYFDNINYLKTNGSVIWLNTPTSQITDRLKVAKTSKPSISISEKDGHSTSINKLLKARKSFYSKAQHILTENEVLHCIEELQG